MAGDKIGDAVLVIGADGQEFIDDADRAGRRAGDRATDSLRRSMVGSMSRIGQKAGRDLGQSLVAGIAPSAKKAEKSLADVKREAYNTAKAQEAAASSANALARAEEKAGLASQAVAKARKRLENATQGVARAEKELSAARSSGDEKQVAAATKALTRAQTENERATDSAARAARNYNAALKGVDTVKARNQLARLREELDRLDKKRVNVKVDVDQDRIKRVRGSLAGLTSVLGSVAKAALKASAITLLGLAAGASIQGIAGLTLALAPLAGALAGIPVAVAAAGIAFATLKVGMSGFGEAMKNMGDPKKFAESLKELSPTARETALAVRSLKPAWDSVQQATQQALFSGVAPVLKNMASAVLPSLRTSLTQTASGFNTFGKATLNAVRNAFGGTGVLENLGRGMKGMLTEASAAMRPFLSAIATLINALSSRLPAAGKSISDVAHRFNAFIQQADQAGKIDDWVDGAKNAFKGLWSILKSLGSIIGGVFKAISNTSSGIAPFAQALDGVAKLVNSPPFQQGLSAFFNGIAIGMRGLMSAMPAVSSALGALGPVLGHIAATAGPLAGSILNTLAGTLKALLPAIVPLVNGLAAGLQPVLAALGPLLIQVGQALVPLGPAIGQLAQMFGGVLGAVLTAFTPLLVLVASALSKLVTILVPFAPLIFAVVTALRAWIITQAVLNGTLAANPLGAIVLAIAAFVAAIIAAYQNVGWFRTVVDAAWKGIQVVIGTVVSWFTGTVAPLFMTVVRAIGSVFSWLYRNVVLPAWNGIRAAVGAVVGWFQTTVWPVLSAVFGFIGRAVRNLAVLYFKVYWTLIKTAVYAVVWWFKTFVLPTLRVVFQSIGAVARWLYNTVIKPVWNSIRSIVSSVVNWIRGTAYSIFKSAMTLIGGIAKWLYNSIIKPYFGFIKSVISGVVTWVRDTAYPIFKGALSKIGSSISWLYNKVAKPVFNSLKTAVGKVSSAFETAQQAIGKAWAKVKGTVKKPVIAALKVVGSGILAGLKKVASWVGLGDKVPSVSSYISTVQKLKDGGPVRGHSPSSTADNIPIAATSGEFMQPVKRVKQYGTQRMEAVRRGVADIVMPSERLRYGLANGGPVQTKMGRPGFAGGGLVAFGRAAQRAGWLASEHPAFGGVRAGHMKGSHHYQGRAIDFNWPGESGNNSPGEVRHAPALVAAARRAGFLTLWQTAGHYNHVHVADAKGKGGGILGAIKGAVSSAFDWAKDMLNPVKKVYNKALSGFKDKSGMGKLAIGGVKKIGGSAINWVKDKLKSFMSMESGNGSASSKAVQRWAPTVLKALKHVGQPASLLQTVLRRLAQESGGNPRAINNWDSNARRGTPSKGLMQVIGPTFAAYRDKALSGDIWNPLANLVASMRYAISRYGSLSAAYNKKGGYAKGTFSALPGLRLVGERGPELINFGGGERVYTNSQTRDMLGGDTYEVNVNLSIDDLSRMNDVAAFIDGLKKQRVNQRRVARSGYTTEAMRR